MYYATARQLEDLETGWRTSGSPADPDRWSQFVRDVEEAISATNRAWMAKLDPQEEPSSASSGGSPAGRAKTKGTTG